MQLLLTEEVKNFIKKFLLITTVLYCKHLICYELTIL